MERYKYQAVDSSGKKVNGIIEAENQASALALLKGNYPVISTLTHASAQMDALNIDIGSKKIKTEALVLMCTQMANMLKCGVQASNAINLVADSTNNKKLRNILYDIGRETSGGSSIADAVNMCAPKSFPETFSETIRAGEESGNIDEAFESLYRYYDRQNNTTKKIKSALIYPVFVLVVAIVVLIIVMNYVIPSLSGTFEDLGGKMPGITKIMIGMSNFFSNYWWLLLIILVVLIAAYQIINHTYKGHMIIDKIKLKLPIIGKISIYQSTAQFASTLAMFLRSGLPLTKSLNVLSNVFKNMTLRVSTKALIRDVEAGRSLGVSMAEKGCFLPTLTAMVENGEKTGNMEEMLESIGAYYQNETDLAIKNALAKLEPTMLILIAIFAGWIVLSIYLPIFQVYSLL